MDRLTGSATPEGTKRFAERSRSGGRSAEGHFRLSRDRLHLGSIGLGTYLGRPDGPTDLAVEDAVSVSVRSGRVNVIDTAINYRFQKAERAIGRALHRQIEGGAVRRDELFVATKNGYLAPDADSTVPPDRYVEVELVKPGILRPAEIVDGSHAMSPAFLRDQFERSRSNLGLETIDLLYLHNAADAQLPRIGREEFERRLRDAFAQLETFRRAGSLVAYGLATWDCFRTPKGSPGHWELEETVRIAREAGGDGLGLGFIQFPFNPAMPEAAAARTQSVRGERLNLFDAARSLGIGCFTSVPLLQGELARNGPTTDGLTRAQSAIQFARSAPGTIGPLVGQKSPDHLSENLRVAESPPWPEERLRALL